MTNIEIYLADSEDFCNFVEQKSYRCIICRDSQPCLSTNNRNMDHKTEPKLLGDILRENFIISQDGTIDYDMITTLFNTADPEPTASRNLEH